MEKTRTDLPDWRKTMTKAKLCQRITVWGLFKDWRVVLGVWLVEHMREIQHNVSRAGHLSRKEVGVLTYCSTQWDTDKTKICEGNPGSLRRWSLLNLAFEQLDLIEIKTIMGVIDKPEKCMLNTYIQGKEITIFLFESLSGRQEE